MSHPPDFQYPVIHPLDVERGAVCEDCDRGHELRKRALGPVAQGGSFEVIWACREEEWQAAQREGREPEGMPWPAEDVRPFVPAAAG